MKSIACIVVMNCCLGSFAFAQVQPAATGSGVAQATHGLQYAVRYAQGAQFSNVFSTIQTSNLSGSLAYGNRNQEKPFALDYAGGYIWNLSGTNYLAGQFHRMYVSQGFNARRTKFSVSEDISYLPDAPTTGFSGIPGTGEVIGGQNPTTTTSNGQAIQTLNTHVLSNIATGQVEHSLNYATVLTVKGTENLLHFPNGDGIETRSVTADAELTRRLNPRTYLYGEYNFQDFDYPDFSVTMQAHTGLVGLRRRMTRDLTVTAAGGPVWVSGSTAAAVPGALTYGVNGSIEYERKLDHIDVAYTRGISSGSGFLIGGELEDTSGNYLHHIGPNFSIGMTGGYMRTLAFNSAGTTNGAYGAAQATWQAGPKLIVFANYTGRGQNSTSLLPGNVLNETDHTVSFGFGFSPKMQRTRQ